MKPRFLSFSSTLEHELRLKERSVCVWDVEPDRKGQGEKEREWELLKVTWLMKATH